MIDFPITGLFDDSLCLLWLERHLHLDGFVCSHCGSANRRLFRRQGYYDAYRCRACDGYYTLLNCNSCEGAGTALRTFLRPFRGVHKAYLYLYVAAYEALVNAKQVSAALICRMCWPPPQPSHAYWT